MLAQNELHVTMLGRHDGEPLVLAGPLSLLHQGSSSSVWTRVALMSSLQSLMPLASQSRDMRQHTRGALLAFYEASQNLSTI